jgi:hypothetical protein
LFLCLSLVTSDPCYYKESSKQDNTNLNSTDDGSFLGKINGEDSKKQKCFSLSNSNVFPHLCCYNQGTGKCEKGTESGGDIYCPVETIIPNKCGMTRFYQPITYDKRTEISLVDGYCCFVKTKTKGNVCVKTEEIDADNKKVVTEDIKEYFKSNNVDVNEIESVMCKSTLLKYHWYEILLLLITIFCLI